MTATVDGIHLGPDTHANRPAATAVESGTLYSCSDHDLIYRSDGAAWATWATLSGTGSAALTTVSASLTADRAIPGTSIYTDIVDLDAIVLPAGTWMGWITLGIKAVANTALNIRVIDGSAVEYAEQEFVFVDVFDIESTFSFHMPPFVLASGVTLKLQGWAGAAFTVKEHADNGVTPTSVVSHATFLKTA